MAFDEFRLQIVDFLNIKIIGTESVFLNLWHIIHLISGGIVMFFIMKFFKGWKKEKKLAVFFALLVLYEFFELSFILSGSALFRGETAWDVVLDLAFGFLGGFLFFKLKKK